MYGCTETSNAGMVIPPRLGRLSGDFPIDFAQHNGQPANRYLRSTTIHDLPRLTETKQRLCMLSALSLTVTSFSFLPRISQRQPNNETLKWGCSSNPRHWPATFRSFCSALYLRTSSRKHSVNPKASCGAA